MVWTVSTMLLLVSAVWNFTAPGEETGPGNQARFFLLQVQVAYLIGAILVRVLQGRLRALTLFLMAAPPAFFAGWSVFLTLVLIPSEPELYPPVGHGDVMIEAPFLFFIAFLLGRAGGRAWSLMRA